MEKKNRKTTIGNANSTQGIANPRNARRFTTLKATPSANTPPRGVISFLMNYAAPWIAMGPVWLVIHEIGHWMIAWMIGWNPYAITFGVDVPTPIRGCRWGKVARWKVGRVWCRTRKQGWRKAAFLLAGSTTEGLLSIGLFVELGVFWHPQTGGGYIFWIWLSGIALTGAWNALDNLLWCPNRKDNFPGDGRRLCHRRPHS